MSLVVGHVFAKQMEISSLVPTAVVHFPKDQLLILCWLQSVILQSYDMIINLLSRLQGDTNGI